MPTSDLRSRLSCADSTFPRLSLATALAVIRDLDLPAVDVCVFAGTTHTTPDEVVADPQRTAETWRRLLDRERLGVADVFGIFGTSFEELALDHPDAAVRAESRRRFDALVAFARELGAPGVTILPGVAFDDDALDRAAAELPERVAAAGDAGLELRVEPHVGSIAETPAQALCLVELVPGLRLTYDESHFAYQGYGQDETAALLPHAGHVHLRQAAPGVMQARTREGSIDFRRHVADLDAAGYRGFLGLEYQWDEWLECTRVDCLSETAELRDLLLS